MTHAPAPVVLQHIRRLVADHGAGELPDEQLLERFATERDEAAFTELVTRHGPLVFRVCRRVLHDDHAAEDAFQATFLVLARKAGSLRRRDRLAGWLHGVACRVAARARVEASRRRRREARAAGRLAADPPAEVSGRELCAVIDDELRRLPERYRTPLLLCYLEGQTGERAARQLGWSLRTLQRRLEQGRELLRVRLARRGLTLSAALLAAALGSHPAPAAVLALLTASTVEAARQFADAATAASAPAIALAQGVVKNLGAARLRGALALLLAAAVAAGASVFVGAGPSAVVAQADDATRPQAGPQPDGRKPHRDRHGDPLPAEAVARIGTVRLRHADAVWGLAFSPDGKTLASAGNDATARLWDAATGKELHRLPGGDRSSFQHVSFAPDGKTLVTRQWSRLRFWDAATGKEQRPSGDARQAFGVVSPDGKLVASLHGETLRVRDRTTGKERQRIRAAGAAFEAAAFSPDGKTIALDHRDNSVRLYDVGSGKETARLVGDSAKVDVVAFSPDGKTLAVAGHEETIRLWDVATGKALRLLKGHTTWVESVAFAPDGKTLVSGSRDWSVRLWDVATGKELRRYEPAVNAYTAVAFAPDGKTVAASGLNGAIQLWDAATGRPCGPDGAPEDGVNQMTFLPDGKTLAATGGEVVRLWDAATGKCLRALPRSEGGVASLALSPDGATLAVGGRDGKLRLWRTADGKELRRLAGGAGVGWGLTYAPDGRTFVSANRGTLRVCDATDGKELRQFKGVATFAVSPDGKLLASASPPDPVIRLWDLATGKELRQIETAISPGYALAFSPDGKTLAAGGGWQGPGKEDEASAVGLWDVATGKAARPLHGHKGGVMALAFSPDGRTLATGGVDLTLRLWEIATGAERHRFEGHGGLVTAVTFSPDGTLLASASRDLTVLMWDVTGRLGRAGPAVSVPAGELDEHWRALAGDAATAYRAARMLIAVPDQSVPLLKAHLRPLAAADGRRVTQLIADLDSKQFSVRDRATKELEKLGESAEAALRQALQSKPFAETRQRLQQLLDRAETWTAERLQAWRALEVLEHIGTAEARQVLRALATGPPEARRTRAVNASLERLSRRPGGGP